MCFFQKSKCSLITVICLYEPCVSKRSALQLCVMFYSLKTKQDRIQNHLYSSIAELLSIFHVQMQHVCNFLVVYVFFSKFLLFNFGKSLFCCKSLTYLFSFLCILSCIPLFLILLMKKCPTFKHVQTCFCLSTPGPRLETAGFFGGANQLHLHRICTF